MKPTLYFLLVKFCGNEWAVFESHRGQEVGCFETEHALVGWFDTKTEAMKCAAEYEDKNLIEGKVVSIEVVE